MEPNVLKYLKKDCVLDMNQLIEILIKKGKKIGVFPINEDEWSDLGNWQSLKKYTN